MRSDPYACPNCLGALPACPAFGADWRCYSCGRIYLALRTADGRPLALDAHHGVFGWEAPDSPVLVQSSVPEREEVRRAAEPVQPYVVPAARRVLKASEAHAPPRPAAESPRATPPGRGRIAPTDGPDAR